MIFSKKERLFLSLGSLIVATLAFLSYYYWDIRLTYYFHNLNSPIKDTINHLSILGESQWYLIGSLVLFLWWRKRGQKILEGKALYVFLANIIAGISVWLLKIPCGRLRPKMLFEHQQYGFKGWGLHYAYVSFPSGHSITIFATATALALLIPRFRLPLFILATLVALSRITLTAHYLSDVLIGSWLGVLISFILYRFMFEENYE